MAAVARALQWQNDHEAFEDRAVEYAVTFELSPPSWEPPPIAEPREPAAGAASAQPTAIDDRARRCSSGPACWPVRDRAARAGSPSSRRAQRRADRHDARSSGSTSSAPARMLNAINRDRRASARRCRSSARRRSSGRCCCSSASRRGHFVQEMRQLERSRRAGGSQLPSPAQTHGAPRRHGSLPRHHHPFGPSARRRRRAGRRRPGHARQRRRQGDRAQGAPALRRTGAGRIRRRDGRRLHAVRALRGEAREAPGPPHAAAVELAKDWRSDRILRRLEAMLAVADATASLVITGTGDVLEPELGIVAIGSGGPYAQAAARALLEHTAAFRRGHRQAVAGDRRRPLHLHQPEPRDRGAGASG